MAAVTMTVTM